MEVIKGMRVGILLRVAVFGGIGLGVSVIENGSVRMIEGMDVALSAVGVEYVPHNEGVCPQAVNNMDAMNKMGRRRFTLNPSVRLYPP